MDVASNLWFSFFTLEKKFVYFFINFITSSPKGGAKGGAKGGVAWLFSGTILTRILVF